MNKNKSKGGKWWPENYRDYQFINLTDSDIPESLKEVNMMDKAKCKYKNIEVLTAVQNGHHIDVTSH